MIILKPISINSLLWNNVLKFIIFILFSFYKTAVINNYTQFSFNTITYIKNFSFLLLYAKILFEALYAKILTNLYNCLKNSLIKKQKLAILAVFIK